MRYWIAALLLLAHWQVWAYGTVPAQQGGAYRYTGFQIGGANAFRMRTAERPGPWVAPFTGTVQPTCPAAGGCPWAAACSGMSGKAVSSDGTNNLGTFTLVVPGSTNECLADSTGSVAYNDAVFQVEYSASQNTCPANSTPKGSSCECALGFKPDLLAGTCSPVNCAAEIEFLGDSAAGGSGLNVCYAGCALRGSVSGQTGGSNVVYGPFTHTGGYCQGTNTGTPAQSTGSDVTGPSPCPKPQCPGTVNGAQVCVPCESTTSSGGSKTTTTPSGAASAPAGTLAGTTVTTTTCSNGSCNTTVTQYGPGSGGAPGAVLSEATTTEPQEAYCQRNPADPVCDTGPESEFGGNCASGFACDGDAVQCAMARDQHVRNCRDLTPNSYTAIGETALGSAANTTVGGSLIGLPSSDINVGTGIIGSAVNPFGAACPADVPLVLGATTVVIPLASTCTALQTMGALLIAITALWCAAWLVKGR